MEEVVLWIPSAFELRTAETDRTVPFSELTDEQIYCVANEFTCLLFELRAQKRELN